MVEKESRRVVCVTKYIAHVKKFKNLWKRVWVCRCVKEIWSFNFVCVLLFVHSRIESGWVELLLLLLVGSCIVSGTVSINKLEDECCWLCCIDSIEVCVCGTCIGGGIDEACVEVSEFIVFWSVTPVEVLKLEVIVAVLLFSCVGVLLVEFC